MKQKSAADILQALDADALGVQVLQVNTEEEARLIVSRAVRLVSTPRFTVDSRSLNGARTEPLKIGS